MLPFVLSRPTYCNDLTKLSTLQKEDKATKYIFRAHAKDKRPETYALCTRHGPLGPQMESVPQSSPILDHPIRTPKNLKKMPKAEASIHMVIGPDIISHSCSP